MLLVGTRLNIQTNFAMNYILSADIGGTKTLLRLAQRGCLPLWQKSFVSAAYSGMPEMLHEFLREAGPVKIAAACLAVAGPVRGRHAQLTNLPWAVDADALATEFLIPQLALINDFEAVGYGISALQTNQLLTLQTGVEHAHAPQIVVGAGTGLGVAWLTWQDGAYKVHPSEAGHLDFAPTTDLEYELLKYLQRRHGHVSYERIVSGPGLLAIYEFLRDTGVAEPSLALVEEMQLNDGGATISRFALENDEPLANLALDLFVKIYGAFVGNIALAALPRGGIFIAGGIAAKISQRIEQGEFLRHFLDKGRFTALLASLPLQIVLEAQVGLLGAEQFAARSL
jgi:glucokinase